VAYAEGAPPRDVDLGAAAGMEPGQVEPTLAAEERGALEPPARVGGRPTPLLLGVDDLGAEAKLLPDEGLPLLVEDLVATTAGVDTVEEPEASCTSGGQSQGHAHAAR
jgi:hypothetical protein